MDVARRYAAVAQLVRQRVDAAQALVGVDGPHGVHLRVDHRPAARALIVLRLAEEDVLHARVVDLAQLGYALEPQHLYGVGAVREEAHQASLGALALRGEGDKPPLELQGGHLALQVADAVDLGPVHVCARIVAQKVMGVVHADLLAQELGALRANALYKLYVNIA